MKDLVLIKSFPNGINLIMKEEPTFEEVLAEVAVKFSEAKNFFGKANMVLSFEGRKLSDAEEMLILEEIQKNSNLNIICIVGRDEEKNKSYLKALQQVEKKFSNAGDGQFYKGSLKNREQIETEKSIVILGDVNPGCTVVSDGNIIVLGGLYGEAYAGGAKGENAYIVALEMEPERLKIGDFKYKYSNKPPKWGIHLKVQPKVAYVKNGKIVFEALTKELLGSF